MSRKIKALVFIDHDIIIRHFVHSGVFQPLMASHDVVFVFPDPEYKRRVTIDVRTLGLGERLRFLPVSENRQPVWSKLAHVNKLRWKPSAQSAEQRRMVRKAIGPGHVHEYSCLALPGVFQWYRWRTRSALARMPYRDLDTLLDEEQPDVLIHPTVLAGVYINDLVEASRRCGIPLVAIMNSWDNPSTKQALSGTPDWLLVWGEQTKRHAVHYARMTAERSVKFGAAQFEVYRHPSRVSREEFCRLQSVDPKKTLLLYAGSSKNTEEYAHLGMLDQAIEAGELGDTVVIYRPHPWGGGGKKGERIIDHPWRNVHIEWSMREYLAKIREVGYVASHSDYRDTRDTLANVDALLSPLSTIILEGALNGKPPLCYLPTDEIEAQHFRMDWHLVHFQEMYRMPEFLIAEGREELVEKTRQLLTRVGDAQFSDRLRQAAKFFVEPFAEPYGDRLVDFVESVATVPMLDSAKRGPSENTAASTALRQRRVAGV